MLTLLRKPTPESEVAVTSEPITPAETMRGFLEAQIPKALLRHRDHVTELRRELTAARERGVALCRLHHDNPSLNHGLPREISKVEADVVEIERRVSAARAELQRERTAFAAALHDKLAVRRREIGERLAALAAEFADLRTELMAIDRFGDDHGLHTDGLPYYGRDLPHPETLRAPARRLGGAKV